MDCGFLLSLVLKTQWWWFPWESEVAYGVITKGAPRRSNFVWSVCPSDQYPSSCSILLSTEWISSMYLGVVYEVVITLDK
jgi:hypothetical protein